MFFMKVKHNNGWNVVEISAVVQAQTLRSANGYGNDMESLKSLEPGCLRPVLTLELLF